MKLTIKNRKGQNIAVLVEGTENKKGLAFLMHGLGGFKEQPHLQVMADAFLAAKYVVVRFDTTNTYGESEGNYEDATTTNYYEDLEDVISWASSQPWYQEPFALAGHSLGAISVALFAEKFPQKVKALAPISTVVSGKLTTETERFKREEPEWRKTGWRIQPSESIPGLIKKLKWSHIEDRLKYDLVPNASKLTMPVLLAAGEFDDGTPIEHQKILFNVLPGPKELHTIKGVNHNFRDKAGVPQLEEFKKIFTDWVIKLG